MAKIARIPVQDIEELTRQLLKSGSRIRELQDTMEMLLLEQKKNTQDYKAGNIQRLAFRDITAKYESEKLNTSRKLTVAVHGGVNLINQIRNIVKRYRL